MKFTKTLIICLVIIFMMTPAYGGDILTIQGVRDQINTHALKVKKSYPVNRLHFNQNRQVIRTWVEGSIDLSKATKRVSPIFNRTTYKQSITLEKLRLPTERLILSPQLTTQISEQETSEQGKLKALSLKSGSPNILVKQSPQLQQQKAVKLVKPVEAFYREGPMYYKFQKLKEMKAKDTIPEAKAITCARNFLTDNKFLQETTKDKVGRVYIQNRHINEEGAEGKAATDYLVQQDIVFERLYEGKPVINSKIVVGFQPVTGEIVLFKHFNWTPIEEQRSEQIDPQKLKAARSDSGAGIINRLEEKIRKYNGNFNRAIVKEAIPAWFQTEESLLPVMAFKIDIKFKSPQGIFQRDYLEVINLTGDDDIFFKSNQPVQEPVKAKGVLFTLPDIKMAPGYKIGQDNEAQRGQQIDLSGTWNSNIGLVYQISQNGNKFSYLDPMMHKPVNGTIDGKTVAVSWMEGNNQKELIGTITSMESDTRAKTISWANGVIFNSSTKSSTVTVAPSKPSQIDMATGYVASNVLKQYSDLSGTWNSNIGLVYEISQNGNKISYQDPMMHKPVNGTVDGKTVTVSWMEGNAVKSIKGTITSVSNDGKAKRIEWQNNVIYHRNDVKEATPIHLPGTK